MEGRNCEETKLDYANHFLLRNIKFFESINRNNRNHNCRIGSSLKWSRNSGRITANAEISPTAAAAGVRKQQQRE
jgi:hypothetical protein